MKDLLRTADLTATDVETLLGQRNVAVAAAAIAELAREHQVVVTHGNGPQVGLLALESSADPALTMPYPLDVLGAETEGMIGYLVERELRNQLPRAQNVLTGSAGTRITPAARTVLAGPTN